MGNDVNFPELVAAIRGGLPAGMTIGVMNLNLTVVNSQQNQWRSGQHLAAGYVRAQAHRDDHVDGNRQAPRRCLNVRRQARDDQGRVDPYPLSNQTEATGVKYSVQLTLTDELLTHRFDVSKKGTK
jgi:hypothetical protein